MALSPRARRRLLLAVVLLGLPALVAAGLAVFLAQGGLERSVEQAWSSRLIGRLEVGRIEIDDLGTAKVSALTIADGQGGGPLLEVPGLEVRGSLVSGRLESLAFRNPVIVFDKTRRGFALDLAADVTRFVRSLKTPIPPLLVTIHDGRQVVGESLTVERVQATWDNRNGPPHVDLAGDLAGSPLRLAFDRVGQTLRFTWVEGRLPLPLVARALGEMGLPTLPAGMLPLLPATADLAGSVAEVTVDGIEGRLDAVFDAATGLGLERLHATLAGPWSDLRLTIDLFWPGVSAPWRIEMAPRGEAMGLRCVSGVVPLAVLVPRLSAVGLAPAQDERWQAGMPASIDLSGTDLVLAAGALTGALHCRWPGPLPLQTGSATGNLSISSAGLRAEGLRVVHPGILEAAGGSIDLHATGGRMAWQDVRPGPLLAFLAGICDRRRSAGGPEAGAIDWLRILTQGAVLMPRGSLTWARSAGGVGFDRVFSVNDGKEMAFESRIPHRGDVRLSGANLPLTYAAAFTDWFEFGAGMVDRLEGVISFTPLADDPRGERVSGLRLAGPVRAATVGRGGWRLAEAAGQVELRFGPDAATPADDDLTLSTVAIDFGTPVGTLHWTAQGEGGRMQIAGDDLTAALRLLRGPVALPLSGRRYELDCDLAMTAEVVRAFLRRLRAADLAVGVGLRGLDLDLTGLASARGAQREKIEFGLEGRLTAGELLVPSWRLPLGAYQPAVRVEATLDMAAGTLDLHRCHLAAGDQAGAMRATASLDGRLVLATGGPATAAASGHMQIVIDPVDLGFIAAAAPALAMPEGQKACGSIALVANLRRETGGRTVFDGWLLPQGGELALFDGAVLLQGLRGALRFPVQSVGVLGDDEILRRLREVVPEPPKVEP